MSTEKRERICPVCWGRGSQPYWDEDAPQEPCRICSGTGIRRRD